MRELTLKLEVAREFAELEVKPHDIEAALLAAWHRRLWREREARRLGREPREQKPRKRVHTERDWARFRAWIASLSADDVRRIRRQSWEKRKADPVRIAAHKAKNAEKQLAKYRAMSAEERKARNRALYEAIKANPERLEKRRAYGREWQRKYRERKANHAS